MGATVNGGEIKQGEARAFLMDPLELMWQLFPRSEILCNAARLAKYIVKMAAMPVC